MKKKLTSAMLALAVALSIATVVPSTGADAAEAQIPCLGQASRHTVVTEHQGSVYRLYCSYFLRQADTEGWDFWSNSPMTLLQASEFFAAGEEFTIRYKSLSNEEFVALIYRNVLDRGAEGIGFSFWVGELNSGRRSRGLVMLQFSDSEEFRAKIKDSLNQPTPTSTTTTTTPVVITEPTPSTTAPATTTTEPTTTTTEPTTTTAAHVSPCVVSVDDGLAESGGNLLWNPVAHVRNCSVTSFALARGNIQIASGGAVPLSGLPLFTNAVVSQLSCNDLRNNALEPAVIEIHLVYPSGEETFYYQPTTEDICSSFPVVSGDCEFSLEVEVIPGTVELGVEAEWNPTLEITECVVLGYTIAVAGSGAFLTEDNFDAVYPIVNDDFFFGGIMTLGNCVDPLFSPLEFVVTADDGSVVHTDSIELDFEDVCGEINPATGPCQVSVEVQTNSGALNLVSWLPTLHVEDCFVNDWTVTKNTVVTQVGPNHNNDFPLVQNIDNTQTLLEANCSDVLFTMPTYVIDVEAHDGSTSSLTFTPDKAELCALI